MDEKNIMTKSGGTMAVKLEEFVDTKGRYALIILVIGLLVLFISPASLGMMAADPLTLVGPLDYPPDPIADIAWSAGTSGVADVQNAFNNARTTENAQLGTSIPMLTLPSQAEWDAKSDGEKALWLINRERVDRGVQPLHGVETNVTSVAQSYAEYLIEHDTFGHTEDGRTPSQRLNANPAIGACHDSLAVAENLVVNSPISDVYLPLAVKP